MKEPSYLTLCLNPDDLNLQWTPFTSKPSEILLGLLSPKDLNLEILELMSLFSQQ
jgi:hypothetical protein